MDFSIDRRPIKEIIRQARTSRFIGEPKRKSFLGLPSSQVFDVKQYVQRQTLSKFATACLAEIDKNRYEQMMNNASLYLAGKVQTFNQSLESLRYDESDIFDLIDLDWCGELTFNKLDFVNSLLSKHSANDARFSCTLKCHSRNSNLAYFLPDKFPKALKWMKQNGIRLQQIGEQTPTSGKAWMNACVYLYLLCEKINNNYKRYEIRTAIVYRDDSSAWMFTVVFWLKGKTGTPININQIQPIKAESNMVEYVCSRFYEINRELKDERENLNWWKNVKMDSSGWPDLQSKERHIDLVMNRIKRIEFGISIVKAWIQSNCTNRKNRFFVAAAVASITYAASRGNYRQATKHFETLKNFAQAA